MHLEITLGAFKQFKLSGSKTNDEEQELNRQQAPIREEMQPLTEAYMAEKDHEKAAAIREQFEPYNERMEVITDEFIRTHTDSYLSPYLMRFRLMSLPVDQVESAYNHWTERVKNSRSGKEIAEEIKKVMKCEPERIFIEMARGGEKEKKRTVSRLGYGDSGKGLDGLPGTTL